MSSNMIRAFAVNARLKGMETCNQERLSNGASIAYTCNHFFEAEEELVGLAESEEHKENRPIHYTF
jgi:hypothetical protein